MPTTTPLVSHLCARCLRPRRHEAGALRHGYRPFTTTQRLPSAARPLFRDEEPKQVETPTANSSSPVEPSTSSATASKQPGAMTQRLQNLSEADLTGTRKEDIENAGFSQDLKNQLLSRIESASSARSSNPAAFSISEMPSAAGAEVRSTAAAEPWTGTESVSDAALRMLNDVHKPIRVPARMPSPAARPPRNVDTGHPAAKGSGAGGGQGHGARLANARDRSSMYGYLKDDSLTSDARNKMRKELRERFTPSARSMPNSLQGLSRLANERIEDAIARGQFKNLPSRGKQIERDYTASSPFLDTTEYFMNRIIQKQEIVPPWIEKQQELVSAAGKFRARLRNDWKRHASRVIASKGGTLEAQVARAEGFARAEMAVNPPRVKVERIHAVDGEGRMSQISLAGEMQAGPAAAAAANATSANASTTPPSSTPAPDASSTIATTITITPESELTPLTPSTPSPSPSPTSPPPHPQSLQFFRSPTYLHTEQAYLTHTISTLNSLTRSYNLMAPSLAQKPYFSLDRELKACYADVAPLLPGEIRERALGRRSDGGDGSGVGRGRAKRGVMGVLGTGHVAIVRDEARGRSYGFREFWRDVFGGGGGGRGARTG